MEMKTLLSIVDNSGTNKQTALTESVIQPKVESTTEQYFNAVNNELTTALKEERSQKQSAVKQVVNRVLDKLNEGKTVKDTAPKPRNFVAKNAINTGAGAHKDKKKAAKQGDVKHKNKELAEGSEFGAYYNEQLAQKVFDENPDLDTSGRADDVVKAGFKIASAEMGRAKAQSLFGYDEDFKGDFVTSYGWLQSRQDQDVPEAYYRRRGSSSAYDRDYASSVDNMNKRDSLAYQLDGGANDEGWGEEPRSNYPSGPQAKTRMVGMFFYNVPAGKEQEAASLGVKQTKSGKWAKTKYNTSGRTFSMQKDMADKAFGDGRWWAPKDESTQISEKAVSKSQQKFMGMVHAAKKGEEPASKEVAKVAKGMSAKAAKDFAATKHKGLPEKKKKDSVKENAIKVGAPVKVYSNVLKKAVFGKVVDLKEGRAYVQYNNTKIVMGHPINEVAAAPVATTAAKVAGASAGKLASRLVPGLGLAVGGYDAYDRAKKGDYAGAALSGAAGLASLIPGVGTAASLGLTGAQLARDYKKGTGAFAPDDATAPAPAPGGTIPNPSKYPTTSAEIKAFQQAKGLTVDGLIGPKTQAALVASGLKKPATAAPAQAATPAPATTTKTSSNTSVQGTLKMGKPSGPITYNGKVVQPGAPEYAAASAALIAAQGNATRARGQAAKAGTQVGPVSQGASQEIDRDY